MSIDPLLKVLASYWLAPSLAILAAAFGFLSPWAAAQLGKRAVWDPLNAASISALAERLKPIGAPSSLQITFDDANGANLALSIEQACRQAGWHDIRILQASGYGKGIVVGRSQGAAALKDALQSQIHIPIVGEYSDSESTYRIIAIGPKPGA